MSALEEWAFSTYVSKSKAKGVMNLVLGDARFWKSIQYFLKYVIPFVQELRLVDGNSKLAMLHIDICWNL